MYTLAEYDYINCCYKWGKLFRLSRWSLWWRDRWQAMIRRLLSFKNIFKGIWNLTVHHASSV